MCKAAVLVVIAADTAGQRAAVVPAEEETHTAAMTGFVTLNVAVI
jgi:hypothetical protein